MKLFTDEEVREREYLIAELFTIRAIATAQLNRLIRKLTGKGIR